MDQQVIRGRCLITGAAGFLGSEIVRAFVAGGWYVTAADRTRCPEHPAHETRLADILDPESLRSGMRTADLVIHAAGLAHIFGNQRAVSAEMHAVNHAGTANVAKVAAESGVRHLVHISSVAVYGGGRGPVSEDEECRPHGAYAESKYLAERAAEEVARGSRMRLTILRLATLYGVGDPGNIGRLIRLIDRGRFVWVGDGSNRKSFLHRDDAARACLVAVERLDEGVHVYNVSSPPCTVRQLVGEIAAALGRSLPSWKIPRGLVELVTKTAASLTRGSGMAGSAHHALEKWLSEDVYDGTKFEKTFGFVPNISLRDGLRQEVDWYRRKGMNSHAD